jgi:hypothetical protein
MVWKDLTRESLEQTKQHFASSGYVMQWYGMAMEVVLTTLGPEWWKKNCITNAVKPDEFLALPDNSENGRYNHQDRIIKLGHMLYALEDSNGYDAFISSLKTRDLAPTFFELWVANILMQNGYEVEFVETKGQKGLDYDLTASKYGITVSAEAKSRRDGIVLTEKTLCNTLEKARKQLPLSGPGIIFVSIPNEWTMTKDAEEVIGRSINSFLRNSTRVNYIILIWHRWIELKTARASASLVRQHQNPNPRTSIELGQVIKPLDEPINLNVEEQVFKPSFW